MRGGRVCVDFIGFCGFYEILVYFLEELGRVRRIFEGEGLT